MSQDAFFVITSGEDGIGIEQLTAAELTSRLNEGYYTADVGVDLTFLTEVPVIAKGCFFWAKPSDRPKNPVFIIKGSAFTPRAVERVTRYQVE